MEYIHNTFQKFNRLIAVLLLLLLCSVGIHVTGAELTPSAQIVSTDTSYCVSGTVKLKIKFKGTPRFGIICNVNYLDGSGSQTIDITTNVQALDLNDMSEDTVWTYEITRTKSYEVTIEKVFDGTMTMSGNPIGWQPNQGTTYGTGKRTVTVDQMPTPFAGPDLSVCNYQDTLNADPKDFPTSVFQWRSDIPSVKFDDVKSRTPIVTVPAEGTYMFWLKEIAGTCNATDSVVYRFQGNATAVVTAPDKEICIKGMVPFTVTSTGNYPMFLRLSNGIDKPSKEYMITTPTHADSIEAISSKTFVIFQIKDKNNCYSPIEDRTGEIKSIDLLPKPIIGKDQVVCGNSIDVTASTDKGVGHWEGAGIFENPTATTTKFTTDGGYGLYPITWLVNNKGCKKDTSMVGEFFKSPFADAGSKQRLFLETETTLAAKEPEFGIGTWFTTQSSVVIAEPNNPKTLISGLPIGITTMRWIEENGICLADTVFTTIEVKEFTYSTAFTPNGDGINDYFEIFGLIQQPVPNNELKVFDVNGRLLFSQKDYKNTWDGKDNSGVELPSGAYYYLFSGDGIEPVKNYLIIKRK